MWPEMMGVCQQRRETLLQERESSTVPVNNAALRAADDLPAMVGERKHHIEEAIRHLRAADLPEAADYLEARKGQFETATPPRMRDDSDAPTLGRRVDVLESNLREVREVMKQIQAELRKISGRLNQVPPQSR